jgi:UDP-2,3-diacylglucosamine hydrolase
MIELPKLALIAGGGQVPLDVASYLKRTSRPFVIIRLEGITDEALSQFEGIEIGLGDFATALSFLQSAQCRSVCMVGNVKRPNFDKMEGGFGDQHHLASIEKAGRQGDDSLLRQVAAVLTQFGIALEGAHEANPELVLSKGILIGSLTSDIMTDVKKAVSTAKAIGALDIGQAVIVAKGLVLAVEAQEGTQAMIKRVAEMPEHIRKNGVLAKVPKPIQDLRLDMPTIGPQTIIDAKSAGLAGIVGIEGQLLLADREATLKQAELDNLFLYGLSLDELT